MRPGIQIVKGRLHVNPEALDDARDLVAVLKRTAADAEFQAQVSTPGMARRLRQNARQARRDADRFALEIERLEVEGIKI